MKTSNMCLYILCIVVLAACKKELNQSPNAQNQSSANSAIQNDQQQSNYKAGEVLVKFKKDVPEVSRSISLARITGTVSKRVLTKTMERSGDKDGFLVVHTPLAVMDVVAKLKALPEVEYAEPNYRYQHTVVSNDPYYKNGLLWGMYGNATSPVNKYGSRAGQAWKAGHFGKTSVFVGVIDEGAQFSHPDLTLNLKNPAEFNGVDGFDDDGNGFVDDKFGWDFYHDDNTTFDAADGDDHGTHVAGTIGAKGGNGQGVAGVCWNVRMVNAKFLGPTGGFTDDAVQAIDYITGLKIAGWKVVATNNSWGGGGFSQALYDAINRVRAQNILFVAAAGNNSSDNNSSPFYPASYDLPNIISVAAINSTGGLAGFSNYGATTVDLGAPGENVYSTLPINTYGSYNGTSMATPHVAGAAALYASTHPTASAAAIKASILKNVTPTPSLTGKCLTGGRLNVATF